MRTRRLILAGLCFLAAGVVLAWNPVSELTPEKKEDLAKAGVDVKFMVVLNTQDNPEYHFVVTVDVPTNLPSSSIDVRHEIRRADKLFSAASWQANNGQCLACFVVNGDSLSNSMLRIQKWYTNKHGTRVASGGFTLKPELFTKHDEFNLVKQKEEAQANSPKPNYVAPRTIPASNLYHAASVRLKNAGLDKQYDTARAFMFWTPSQMGDEFVGFPLVGARTDTNNTLDIHCLVEVNAYREGTFHTNGNIHFFPDKDGLVPYVQFDEKGKLETQGRRKPQQQGGER
jgi:hypothetical protein